MAFNALVKYFYGSEQLFNSYGSEQLLEEKGQLVGP